MLLVYEISGLESKMLGVNWSKVGLSSNFSFSKCSLDYNIFVDQDLSNLKATECSMKEVFFQNCNLSKSSFSATDLRNAQFEDCKLSYADFTDAMNFYISPDNNDVKYAKMSVESALRLLDKYHLTIF